jgi:pSer/pThr/pTyr-binding forkhead associated (FHA) protein/outer membrane biosynthesis protein TonB
VETIKTKQNEMFKIRPVTQSTPSSLGVFGRGRILIGRSESCDYVINSETVSAIHAVMEIFNDRAVIYDMNSTNGTYVNNEKVVVKEFKHGSTFRISELEFEFGPYIPDSDLPPVLDSLDPVKGSASVINSVKSLPDSAPSVTNALPTIVYPLASDPKADFSEYIFEDKDELYPIFNYDRSKQAVEVIVLFKDQIFSVDYLPQSKELYKIAGVQKDTFSIEFPYLGKTETFPFIQASSTSATVYTLPGFDVFLLSDTKKHTGHVGADIQIQNQDILRLQKGDLQIFVRHVQAPPKVAHAPILKRDPEFRKYLALFLMFVFFLTMGLNLVEVPKDERKDELAPERLAKILYKQKLTVSENPLIEKTEKKENVPQKAPDKVAVKKNEEKDHRSDVKNPDLVETKDQSKKPDPGKLNANEKKIVKQGTEPVTKPNKEVVKSSPTAKSTNNAQTAKSPTALSQYQAKTMGHVEVYKSADFKSSLSSLVAKGGSLSGIQTNSLSGSSSDLIGASGGISSGTGQIKTAQITTNQGSLIGAATGVLGDSKGAEGLSSKKAIYTAGIPSETVVLGSMDPDVIRRRLMEYLPQFRSCYQKELESRGTDINGMIKLNFVIGSTGHVAKSGLDGSTPLPRDVSSCVLSVLRGITFPEPMGGGTVEVKQPMNFQPKRI